MADEPYLKDNLLIMQGADYSREWPVILDGVAVTNFTGWSAQAECRVQPGGALFFEFETFFDTGVGIRLSTAITTPMEVSNFLGTWDLVIAVPGLGFERPVRGSVRIVPAVTVWE